MISDAFFAVAIYIKSGINSLDEQAIFARFWHKSFADYNEYGTIIWVIFSVIFSNEAKEICLQSMLIISG